MDSVNKEELLKLVHSFLKEIHLMKTARCLEQETGEVCRNYQKISILQTKNHHINSCNITVIWNKLHFQSSSNKIHFTLFLIFIIVFCAWQCIGGRGCGVQGFFKWCTIQLKKVYRLNSFWIFFTEFCGCDWRWITAAHC